MAPEQAFGEAVTPATDVYSLGLTMAEMLSGQPIVRAESVSEIYTMLASREPAVLDLAIVGSPLGAIIERAVSKVPTDRFTTAGEMLTAIEALGEPRSTELANVPLAVATRTAIGYAKTQATPMPTAPEMTASTRPAAPSRTAAIVVGAVALASVATVLAIHFLSGRSTHASPTASGSSVAVIASAPPPVVSGTNDPSYEATIVPKTGDALMALLDSDGWQHISPPATALGSIVAPIRKAGCAGNVLLRTEVDEPHARLLVENLHRNPQPFPSYYDGRLVISINIAAGDPGANVEACQRDIETLVLQR